MAPREKTDNSQKQDRPFDQRFDCLICGQPSGESICEHCKIKVQAEALEQKRRIEKGA